LCCQTRKLYSVSWPYRLSATNCSLGRTKSKNGDPRDLDLRGLPCTQILSSRRIRIHTPVLSSSLRRPWLWVLPSFVWLALLIAAPLVFICVLSLAHREASGGIDWVFGLTNYLRAFDPLYLRIYWRSFILAVATTLFCLVLGFPVAQFIASQKSAAAKNFLLLLVTLPFWTSFLVRMYAWMILLRAEGPINNVLLDWRIVREPIPLLYSNFAILVGLVYGELPFMILPLYTVLEKIEKPLLEASADLGCSSWQTFWRVLLPLSRSGINAGVILVFIPSLGAFLAPDLLGGAKSMMAGSLIQSQFAVVRDQPFGSAIASLLAVLVLALLAVSYKATQRSVEVRTL
jgi:spermidine/putrescine transport system permease protein